MFNMNSLGAFLTQNHWMTHNHRNASHNTAAKVSDEKDGFKLYTVPARHITIDTDGFVAAGEELCEEMQLRFPPAIKLTEEVFAMIMRQNVSAFTHTGNNGLDRAANSISLVPGMRINMGNGDFIDIERSGVSFNGGGPGASNTETRRAAGGLNILIRWANDQLTIIEGLQSSQLRTNPATERSTIRALQNAGLDTSRPFTINGTAFEVRNGTIVRV